MKRNLKYKGIEVNSFGIPIFYTKVVSSKKKEGRYIQYKYFDSEFKKESPKNLIVMYDIPHEKKKERDWFRRHLKQFNYMMIQKSIWVGPSPLPKDFLNYVKSIGLLSKLKTFKLAKPYTGEENIYKNAL
jgi:DNA-binding transcriptional regulator PaaX